MRPAHSRAESHGHKILVTEVENLYATYIDTFNEGDVATYCDCFDEESAMSKRESDGLLPD